MLSRMAEKTEPLIFVARRMIKNDGLSPSNLEIYDRMHWISCNMASAKWKPDWAFCPVCMAAVDEFGVIRHQRIRLT